MTKEVKIFNPAEKPYGVLSNNYRKNLVMDGKTYPTVTNYVYSKLLNTSSNQRIIQWDRDLKNIFSKTYIFMEKERDDNVKMFLDRALVAKFDQYPELSEKLKNTGNSPIVYVSTNPLLGNGESNQGENLYGKYLEQIRYRINNDILKSQKNMEAQEREQTLVDTYLAYKGLIDSIRKGFDINIFSSKTPVEIVEKIGRGTLEKREMKRDYILHLETQGTLDPIVKLAMSNPSSLVPAVLKREMRNFRIRKIKERNEIVFNMYTDYVLRKEFPDLDPKKYKEAKSQQFDDLPFTEKSELEKRVFTCYKEGNLSENFSKMVDERLSSFYIPEESEVERMEGIEFGDEPEKEVEKPDFTPSTGEPVLVYPAYFEGIEEKYVPYLEFSPISKVYGPVTIDKRVYPTISHFITTSLLGEILGIDEAYRRIIGKNMSYIRASEEFEKVNRENIIAVLKREAARGMDWKFSDNRKFQDILLSSGKSRILYTDRVNAVLGTGRRGEGNNFVGKYLEKIRSELERERKKEGMTKINRRNLVNILEFDTYLNDWVRMRTRDMCKTVVSVKNYVYEKFGKTVNINVNFVENVLDTIYQPCSELFISSDEIDIPPPSFFKEMVRKCSGFSYVSDSVIEIFWNRIVVMIYYLLKFMKQRGDEEEIGKMKNILATITNLVSEEKKCEKVSDYGVEDNCIVSALVNLLERISAFNEKSGNRPDISNVDVGLAASIILNRDVMESVREVDDLLDDFGMDLEDELDQEEREVEGYDEYEGDSSPYISEHLKSLDHVSNPREIESVIKETIDLIKTGNINKQVKRNRINFFATTLN